MTSWEVELKFLLNFQPEDPRHGIICTGVRRMGRSYTSGAGAGCSRCRNQCKQTWAHTSMDRWPHQVRLMWGCGDGETVRWVVGETPAGVSDTPSSSSGEPWNSWWTIWGSAPTVVTSLWKEWGQRVEKLTCLELDVRRCKLAILRKTDGAKIKKLQHKF